MSLETYEAVKLLGEGSYGKVYLMKDKVRRGLVCVKMIKIKNIPKKEREATVWRWTSCVSSIIPIL